MNVQEERIVARDRGDAWRDMSSSSVRLSNCGEERRFETNMASFVTDPRGNP